MKTYLGRHSLLLWLELRGRRVIPDYADLDPYRLAPVLASRFVLDIGADTVRAVETGTRIQARLPVFAHSPRNCFSGLDGKAFEEFARIVADEGHGAVIIAEAEDVTLEILLLPLTFHRLMGRRVFGVAGDCNPYAKPGPAKALKILSCRFLSKELHDFFPSSNNYNDDTNPPLTARDHSRPIILSSKAQKLTPKIHPRLLQ